MNWIKNFLREAENGQAVILFAVLAGTMMAIMGLAVEGGSVLVQYRKLQSAADMAALVGAQKLPCKTSDSACINTAAGDACTYASQNGGYSCTINGSTAPSANVPPRTCSPYSALDYGNNTSCGLTSGNNPEYSFIEVQLQYDLGTIPIFNTPVTLSAHAVAKHGITSPTDFAVSVLDPSASPGFNMGGSGNVVVVGDTMSNSSIGVNGNGGRQISCDGSWFTAATQSIPSNSTFMSNLAGSANFAAADCTGGTDIYPASMYPNSPPIPDPYGNTVAPSASNLSTTCPACASGGWYYTWKSSRTGGTWAQASSSSSISINSGGGNLEMFPGVYGSLDASGGNVYFNPGIYTFNGSVTIHGNTNICVYGAPACDQLGGNIPGYNFGCNSANFSGSSVSQNIISSDVWYYYCSPWGVWDKYLARPSGSGPTTTPPTFYDPTGSTSVPLNGITIYMASGDFSENGNAGTTVAFPNGCPGTGTASTGSVQFQGNPIGEPSGSWNAAYTYPSTSLTATDYKNAGYSGTLTSTQFQSSAGTATQVYPSADLTLDGECKNGLQAWNGEFPSKSQGQHLQFVLYANNNSTNMTLNGDSVDNWWGIVHTFPNNYAGYPGAPTANCGGDTSHCQVSLSGNGNSSSNGGPPMLMGQIVAGTATWSGNSSDEIFYRPCRALKTPCGTGSGSSLIQ